MKPKRALYAHADEAGRLILSPELASCYGIKPGARVRVDEAANGLHVRRSPTQLAKLYIEPTNQCNLNCRTCIRNVWNEPMGKMPDAVFACVIEGLRAFSPPPTVFFGGFGEPLFHPKIVEMVARAKALGASVELITNGTQLTPELSRELIAAGINVLWVSIDGARPESYADIRLGAELPQVLENVAHFRDVLYAAKGVVITECGITPSPDIQLGIAFVAMKRNIADWPAVQSLGWQMGAKRFLVTNVLPYAKEMRDEVLYYHTLSKISYLDSAQAPRLSLPRMDENETTRDPLYWAMRSSLDVTPVGSSLEDATNRCPFVESGAGAIGWDGSLSPCLPLLHDHVSFVADRERFSRRWTIGNVAERSLPDLWNAPEHIAFRERVQAFGFPPCVLCGGCDLSDTNEKDCLGNVFPTCGGCLWAQGLIQCP